MSTLKSNNEDMTINADGASSEVKFQANGVEKASIDQDGNLVAGSKVRLIDDTASKVEFGDSGNASIGKIEYTHSSNQMYFKVNDAERLRILAGGGITFNGDTASANALDDYEEGTFTPYFVNVTVNSYDYQNGRYTKIGDSVFFHIDIETTVMDNNDSSAINVAGLPFTVATIPNIPVASLGATKGVNVAHPEMYIMSGQPYMLMASFSPSTGDTTSWATYQNLGTTVRLYISGHYKI